MVCIYCGSGTGVTNSRSKARTPSVWRRRACKVCVAQFTTIELPDYATALLVVSPSNKNLAPFNRDKLLISIYKSLGHRPDPTKDATALTTTIIGKILRKRQSGKNGTIQLKDITTTTYEVLRHFDIQAANSYRAYHPAS